MDCSAYEPDAAIYDKMFRPTRAPREHGFPLHETLSWLSDAECGEIQDRVSCSFLHEGTAFTVDSDGEAEKRVIPIDCDLRVMFSADRERLEAGLI